MCGVRVLATVGERTDVGARLCFSLVGLLCVKTGLCVLSRPLTLSVPTLFVSFPNACIMGLIVH